MPEFTHWVQYIGVSSAYLQGAKDLLKISPACLPLHVKLLWITPLFSLLLLRMLDNSVPPHFFIILIMIAFEYE